MPAKVCLFDLLGTSPLQAEFQFNMSFDKREDKIQYLYIEWRGI